MKSFLWRVGVPLVAVVLGFVSAFPVFALGLIVPSFIVMPLVLLFAGLFAALGAAWTGNLLAPDQTASRLFAIVIATEAMAAILTGVSAVVFPLLVDPGPATTVLLTFGILGLAIAASIATWRFRSPARQLGRDAALTLGLIAAGVATVVVSVFITCSFVRCIA